MVESAGATKYERPGQFADQARCSAYKEVFVS